jgi:hypothetical protein
MEPKKLLKIRLKEDGTWEHVYENHQNDIFQELDASLLNELQKQTRMSRRERMQKKAEDYIEEALELSDYEESKIVLSHIMNLK